MVEKLKKICVVTGTRAEYGLLRWVIDGLDKSPTLNLQLIATGMHLSSEYGMTIREIKKDGYKISNEIEMLLSSDTPVGISKSIGLGIIGFADAYTSLKPDMVLLLGDRFEILSAAIAAMSARIPIAHIHGGEATEGLIDESIRHSITKMSHLHFVATEEYRKRVIQLGENPKNVFNVGGLGIDNINKLDLLSKRKLENILSINFNKRNLLITYHPVTLEANSSCKHIDQLLNVLEEQKETNIIFTMPNADMESRILSKKIKQFCEMKSNAYLFTSLGQLNYLSCLQFVDAVIGNSSSGLLEVPTFKKGTINIGDRQKGRICAKSVINCQAESKAIRKAINHIYSEEFKETLSSVNNPYGDGGASAKIVKRLENVSLQGLLKKKFFNL